MRGDPSWVRASPAGATFAPKCDVFLDAHTAPPSQIILDLDATDDPLHGHQEGRFFHGYYDNYCYLPLYVFCGRHLLVSKLRPADIDASAGSVEEVARVVARIRQRGPAVRLTGQHVISSEGIGASSALSAAASADSSPSQTGQAPGFSTTGTQL
jgi:hypothetical protein